MDLKLFTVFVLFLTFAANTAAVQRHVPGRYETIQGAIDDANDGDEVVIAPGTYTGDGNRDIDFRGKPITVRSIDPEDANVVAATIIDCNGYLYNEHRGFRFISGEERDSVLSGLTIINGWAKRQENPDYFEGMVEVSPGGAVYCENSSPTIRRCVIRGNRADDCGVGAGVFSYKGSPRIEYSVFNDNTAIYGRHLGGAICIFLGEPEIINCLVYGNQGRAIGGIYCKAGIVSNCTIVDNRGGGFWGGGDEEVTNCIIRGNELFWDPRSAQIGGAKYVTYCNVQGGYAGTGNFDADPAFVDRASGDYRLTSNSGGVNAGDPAFEPQTLEGDLEGNSRIVNGRIDVGTYELQQTGPVLWRSPRDLRMFAVLGGADPKPEILEVLNTGEGAYDWWIEADCPWLSVNPSHGTCEDRTDIVLEAHIAELEPGTHICEMLIRSPDAIGAPQPVLLELTLSDILVVPSHYPTIQAAIDAADDYDHILVEDGRYTGPGNRDISFCGKTIILRSRNGPADCIIDCNASFAEQHRGFHLVDNSAPDSVISGFTITNGCMLGQGYWSTIGGAILCIDSTVCISDCVICGNAAFDGGGIYTEASNLSLQNCTISSNLAYDGGGIYVMQGWPGLVATSCIVWGNRAVRGSDFYVENGYIFSDIPAPVEVSYCNVRRFGEPDDELDLIIWGPGNMGEHPGFANPGYWLPSDDPNVFMEPDDFTLEWIPGDYHLKSQAGRWDPGFQSWVVDEVTSPCIDSGDPQAPLGAEPFPNGGRINMGAYGGTARASKSYFGRPTCKTIIAGDINGDCKVDFMDLAILCVNWNRD